MLNSQGKLKSKKYQRSYFSYLKSENYYWLFKKFVIFDVDKGLNIHLIFMNLSPMSEEFGVTKSRLRSIISANEEVGMAIRNR